MVFPSWLPLHTLTLHAACLMLRLPDCIIPLHCLRNCSKASLVEKHTYIMSLQERNERLFYYVLSEVR
jgi:hypothetical protein